MDTVFDVAVIIGYPRIAVIPPVADEIAIGVVLIGQKVVRIGIADGIIIRIGHAGQVSIGILIGDRLALWVCDGRDAVVCVLNRKALSEVVRNLGKKATGIGQGECVPIGVRDFFKFPVRSKLIGKIALFAAKEVLARRDDLLEPVLDPGFPIVDDFTP
jgi:hypothetical protein